jgi:hypothetical protein
MPSIIYANLPIYKALQYKAKTFSDKQQSKKNQYIIASFKVIEYRKNIYDEINSGWTKFILKDHSIFSKEIKTFMVNCVKTDRIDSIDEKYINISKSDIEEDEKHSKIVNTPIEPPICLNPENDILYKALIEKNFKNAAESVKNWKYEIPWYAIPLLDGFNDKISNFCINFLQKVQPHLLNDYISYRCENERKMEKIKKITIKDEVIKVIKNICNNNELEYNDNIITEFFDWYPTADIKLTYLKDDEYENGFNDEAAEPIRQIAIEWAAKYSRTIQILKQNKNNNNSNINCCPNKHEKVENDNNKYEEMLFNLVAQRLKLRVVSDANEGPNYTHWLNYCNNMNNSEKKQSSLQKMYSYFKGYTYEEKCVNREGLLKEVCKKNNVQYEDEMFILYQEWASNPDNKKENRYRRMNTFVNTYSNLFFKINE